MVNTLEQALSVAESVGIIDGSEEVVVMGGEQIYALALPKADRLYMTEVHADVDGDAHFPEFDRTQWQELARENHAAAGPNPYDYSFVILERKV